MAKIEGLDKVIAALRKKAAAMVKDVDVSCVVGYTASYAIFVHENIDLHPPGMRLAGVTRSSGKGAYWDPQGRAQPKFLEGPFRRNKLIYTAIVRKALLAGRTMSQALLLAGLQLQRDSMLLCPVDTGNLKASAFTRLETADGRQL